MNKYLSPGWISLLLVLPALAPALVTANDDGEPQAMLTRAIKGRIKELGFKGEKFPVERATNVAKVKGTFVKKNWTLVQGNGKVVPVASSGEFELPVEMKKDKTNFTLMAISPDGSVVRETSSLHEPTWMSVEDWKKKEASADRFSWSPSLGITRAVFHQSGSISLNQWLTTLKVGANYAFPNRKWDLAFAGYVSLLNLKGNLSAYNVRYLGMNLRLGYELPFVKAPWRLSLLGGLYFTTMMVSPEHFGYTNQLGPQIFPLLTYTFANKASASVYAKYSLVGSPMKAANREWAMGASYRKPIRGGKNGLIYSLDFSQLKYSSGVENISLTTTSLSVGYGF